MGGVPLRLEMLLMRGQVLDFSVRDNSGIISGDDGRRYSFSGSEWQRSAVFPAPGMRVDFVVYEDIAVEVFPDVQSQALNNNAGAGMSANSKSNVAAGVLAILLGGLGIHKFYLGYTAQGLILLAASFVSLLLWVVVIGALGTLAIYAITIIEGVIYLTKSSGEFHRTYVAGRKPWF